MTCLINGKDCGVVKWRADGRLNTSFFSFRNIDLKLAGSISGRAEILFP